MIRYKNHTGNSGILAYEIGDDWIIILFQGRGKYLYTHHSNGRTHIEAMKKLAQQGAGLATYVNKYVRDKYEEKLE